MTGPEDAASGRSGSAPGIGRRSALHDILCAHPQPLPGGAPPADTALAIGERAFLGKVLVLGSGDAFHAAVSAQLGFALPLTANTTESDREVTAMWLSPSEWMVLGPPGRETDLTRSLGRALGDIHALVIDVSDRWTVVAVAGSQAVSVLGKGTSVPLAPPAFEVGQCCQTRLFSCPAIIRQTDTTPSFDVFVDSTLAEHLWRWLEHAADGFVPYLFTPAA